MQWLTWPAPPVIPRTLPFADGGHAISFFRQALSLDERRARFPPQLWMDAAPEKEEAPCPLNRDKIKHSLPGSQVAQYPVTNGGSSTFEAIEVNRTE
jgi:hypothetical protein